jgi:hypothetical protein
MFFAQRIDAAIKFAGLRAPEDVANEEGDAALLAGGDDLQIPLDDGVDPEGEILELPSHDDRPVRL